MQVIDYTGDRRATKRNSSWLGNPKISIRAREGYGVTGIEKLVTSGRSWKWSKPVRSELEPWVKCCTCRDVLPSFTFQLVPVLIEMSYSEEAA